MVQEYLNLDEAARELGITADELKQKVQRREIPALADPGRGTWKFRKQVIEEHARQAGLGSGAEIVFGELDDALDSSGSSDQILLSEQALGDSPGGSGARVIGMDEFGRTPSDSDVRLVPEESLKKGSDSDVKLVAGAKPPSDSDVKVVPAVEAPKSDSDVKIKGPAPGDSDVRLDRAKPPADSGVRIAADTAGGEVTQDLPVFGGSSEEELAITTGSSGEQPIAAEADSDFELRTDAGLGKAGDSDITLALDDNTGLVPDEIKLAPKGPSDSDVTLHSPSASGINLGSPADSGIALDKAPPSKSGRALGATEGPAKMGSDIFETDFDVPVLGSEAEAPSSEPDTAQLSADSDFELSDSDLIEPKTDRSSQVLEIEGEEAVDESARTSLAPAPAEEQWEEEVEAPTEFEEESGAASMVEPSGEVLSAEEPVPSGVAVMPVAAAEAEWGVGWIVTLSGSTLLMLVVGMVMLDLVRTMWGWDSGTSLYSSPILNGLSGLFFK
jgi:hypothetical protein